jgi:outer membrane protein
MLEYLYIYYKVSRMFKILLIFLLVVTNLYPVDEMLIRTNKLDIINEQKKEIEANAQKIKYDWISPLNLSHSYSRSNIQGEGVSDTSLNLTQDVFRSGGIIYKIAYADIKLKNSLSSLSLENTSLYKELYSGLLALKKLRLILKQNHFTFLNTEIEVFLKTQQYKTGDVDITELNRALREKNSALKIELTAKQAIVEKEIELKKLTDVKLESIDVPIFKMLSKEEYQESNYNLEVSKLNGELSDTSYKITRSSYLPTISINGAYGYRDNPTINFNDDYYSFGATLSMPLDYNYYSTLQESKAVYLTNKLQIQETKIDEMALYKAGISRIQNYEAYKIVTQENISLYTNLIKIVQKALKSGLKTGYDLKTLQNTKKIDEIELEISNINIQIELVELTFATKRGESYYE